jgi:hypothetical protein
MIYLLYSSGSILGSAVDFVRDLGVPAPAPDERVVVGRAAVVVETKDPRKICLGYPSR